MRNLVYVSMTRAKNALVITWWGNGGSRFIAEMDPGLYETEGSAFKISVPNTVQGSDGISITKSDKEEKPVSTPVLEETRTAKGNDLVGFLKGKGLEIIDKRERGGALWVVGGKELDAILKETRKLYGALWTFSQNGGKATGNRTSWFTKCSK